MVPRIALLGVFLSSLVTFVLASDVAHWAAVASRSKDGIIRLDSNSYEEILSSERDYSVVVVLTALPAQFKCAPCHEFNPSWHQVAASWKKAPKYERDHHFFAQLDFADGQEIYKKLGLTTAPTVQFHPVLTGPNKSAKEAMVPYDLNRQGLSTDQFHGWITHLTPVPFNLHKPFNPVPFVMIPASIVVAGMAIHAARPVIVPVVQSRIVWGIASVLLILTFTSGHMWNRIKGTPYVAMGPGGKVSWIAGGYQNQLGLESQVVAAAYGALSCVILALTIFVPAQTSPAKQRVGVYLWLALFVVLFSLLIKLFRVKNESYPYRLLF